MFFATRPWFLRWVVWYVFDVDAFKAGFRSGIVESKWNRKSAYDPVKIKNRSRKQSHMHDGIGIRRIRTFSFLLTPLTGHHVVYRAGPRVSFCTHRI